MASKAMVEAAERKIESGGNLADAIDAAIRAQVVKMCADWPSTARLSTGQLVATDALLKFFEVSP